MKIGKLEIVVKWNGDVFRREIKKFLLELKGIYAIEMRNDFAWKIYAIKWYRDQVYTRTGAIAGLKYSKELVEEINHKYHIFYDERYYVKKLSREI